MGNIFFAHGHFSGHGPWKKSHGPNYFPMAKKNGKKVAMAQINSLRHKIHRLSRKEKKKENKVDSSYLQVEGTLWNTSRYPHFDISNLQKWIM